LAINGRARGGQDFVIHFRGPTGVGAEELRPEFAGTSAFLQGVIVKKVIASTLAVLISGVIAPAVHAQTDSTATDGQLAHSVRVAFAHNGVGMSHVFVFARSGQVTLIGWVPEGDQVALAEQTATTVPGVTSVNNLLSRGGGRLGN
jgi:BON domain